MPGRTVFDDRAMLYVSSMHVGAREMHVGGKLGRQWRQDAQKACRHRDGAVAGTVFGGGGSDRRWR
jgi:hypothetical protein